MMVRTVIVIVEPGKANMVLAELGEAGAEIVSVAPIYTGAVDGREDILVTFTVEHESADAQYSFLTWVEDTLGPSCEVF